ncbi:hypothetical protein [Pedococcus aerophilus]
MPGDQDAKAIADAVIRASGPIGQWAQPAGYPTSLALCIIDSIQSVGVRYKTVENVVDRYRNLRGTEVANTDGAPELAAVFDDIGVDGFIATVGNRNRTSTQPGAALKAEVIQKAAALLSLDAPTAGDLRGRATDLDLEARWRDLPGQRSGITWRYLLMLANVPSVKPDRMVRRFVSRSVGRPETSFTTNELVRLVTLASQHLGVSPTLTDHLIWRTASGRGPRPITPPSPGAELAGTHLHTPHEGQRVHGIVSLGEIDRRQTRAGYPWGIIAASWNERPIKLILFPMAWDRYAALLGSPAVRVVGDLTRTEDGTSGLSVLDMHLEHGG